MLGQASVFAPIMSGDDLAVLQQILLLSTERSSKANKPCSISYHLLVDQMSKSFYLCWVEGTKTSFCWQPSSGAAEHSWGGTAESSHKDLQSFVSLGVPLHAHLFPLSSHLHHRLLITAPINHSCSLWSPFHHRITPQNATPAFTVPPSQIRWETEAHSEGLPRPKSPIQSSSVGIFRDLYS